MYYVSIRYVVSYLLHFPINKFPLQTFTCLKLTIETLENGVKSVQS